MIEELLCKRKVEAVIESGQGVSPLRVPQFLSPSSERNVLVQSWERIWLGKEAGELADRRGALS